MRMYCNCTNLLFGLGDASLRFGLTSFTYEKSYDITKGNIVLLQTTHTEVDTQVCVIKAPQFKSQLMSIISYLILRHKQTEPSHKHTSILTRIYDYLGNLDYLKLKKIISFQL